MTNLNTAAITVQVTINKGINHVWQYWTNPIHITKWNFASPVWHAPFAENDLKVGGKFKSRMEAVDGTMGFDFEGIYDEVETHKSIAYSLGDGRKVKIIFNQIDENTTEVIETFDPENENPIELQQAGWQAILNNFKQHAENN